MDIDYLLLADAAMAVQGKHYLLGAGWDTVFAPSFPASYPSFGVALRVRATGSEERRAYDLEVDVVDATGRSILPVPPGPLRSAVDVRQADRLICMAFTLIGIAFPSSGTYAVVARLEGGVEFSTPFTVEAAPGS